VSRPTKTSLASWSVQVRGAAAAPVSLKLALEGAAEVPARYKLAIGRDAAPRSHSAAAPGTRAPPAAGTVNVQEPEPEPLSVIEPEAPAPTVCNWPAWFTCQPTPLASACHGIAAEPGAVVMWARIPVAGFPTVSPSCQPSDAPVQDSPEPPSATHELPGPQTYSA